MKIYGSNNLKAFSLLFSGLMMIQSALFLRLGAVSLLALSGFVIFITLLNAYGLAKTSSRLPGPILNTAFVVYLGGLCYKTGGFFSISMMLLFFIPLLTTVLKEKKVRAFYLVVAVLLFGCFYFEQRVNAGFFVSDRLVNISLYRFYNLSAILGCFFGMITVYVKNTEQTAIQLAHARQECRQISEKTHQAMKVKDEFLANMSHEIRNPMNGILGMIHVLLDSDLDEDQREYSQIAYNSARALLTIVNDILDLSKIEAGKLELNVMDFDLDIAIKDIVSLPELQARQKGIIFSYSIHPEVPCLLQGDIGRIRQVINNLTGNAIKFTDAGEVTLNITLKSEDETRAHLYFNVEDTGIGIKENQLNALFESFTQADLSITKKYGGTGLGLAISKLLVEKMGGKIGAESIDMIGSSFWFILPLKKQLEKQHTFDFSNRNIDACRILVLSEGITLGKRLETTMNSLALDYDQAFDDTEAIEMLRWAKNENMPFPLMIMEVKESDQMVETVARKIKQDQQLKDTKLILVSSIGKKGDARRFEEAGFSAFLSGPVEKSLLLDGIKAALSRPGQDDTGNLPIITRYSILETKKHLQQILIVEDMETNILMAKAVLAKQGYQTDAARNGQEAVQKHKEKPYDLILMDCQMPVLDGFEATRQIRENEKVFKMDHVPIIAMTGNAFESDRKKCFDAGMDDFLSKPVDPDILAQKIRSNFVDVALSSKKTPFREPGKEPTVPVIPPASLPSEISSGASGQILCFNKDKLFERFGEDEELIDIVVTSFFQEAPVLIERIGNAVNQKNVEQVRSNAHALKGSAANINADLLSKAALEMETLAKIDCSDAFSPAFESLQTEYNRFIREAQL
ncbi:hybrid sensor histidine kinase/response regulator [Desulfobacula sp.]|uniref:hybrid sensor histidine kinase/response regulator n=1 Tax=Desulfobacula sp. TaxID=2593537 RepID=UPI00260EC284|nr:hybrid sensor histidine kinase/response regulator [Desulfobacula sp.]